MLDVYSAEVMKLVDMHVSEACAAMRAGSTSRLRHYLPKRCNGPVPTLLGPGFLFCGVNGEIME